MDLRVAEAAARAGMLLARLDPKRNDILMTRDDMRGKVKASELRVPSSDLAKRMGAAGADLVIWLVRGAHAGVVWAKGERVRYLEGLKQQVLPESVLRAIDRTGWTE